MNTGANDLDLDGAACLRDAPAGSGSIRLAGRRRRAAHPGSVLAELVRVARRGGADIARLLTGAVRRAGWRRTRRGVIRTYFDAHSVRKLQLGSGPVSLPGWLNGDLRPRTDGHIFLDALERFPFADGTVDYILAEHMIGDLSYDRCALVLSECRRVLRPGGRLRLSTPDLARLASLYAIPRSDAQEHYLRWSIENNSAWADAYLPGLVINNMFQDYPFLYDADTLTHLLQIAGFGQVTSCASGQSDDPELVGVESHGRVIGDDRVNAFESLTMEAVKPAAGASA